MPTLSIITINRNNAAGLTRTLQSVVSQTFTGFEHLVIDGASDDGSVDVIERFRPHLTYAVSEADRGIYAAMNKGITQATGTYCLFLNSGDWLADDDVLQTVLAQNTQADIIAGDVFYFDNEANAVKWLVPSPDQLTAKRLMLGTLPHQATFIRRSLFDQIGRYSEQLKIAADWLFFVEALLVHHCTYQHHKQVISYFSMDGISCDPKQNALPRREQLAVLRQKYPLFLPDYERLDELETQLSQWTNSREYEVYEFFKRTGLVRAGVFCGRVLRKLRRNVSL